MAGLLGAEKVDGGHYLAQAVQQRVRLAHDVGRYCSDRLGVAVALGDQRGQLGGPALDLRAQVVQVLGDFWERVLQAGADMGAPAGGVKGAEQHLQAFLQVLRAGLARAHLAGKQAHPRQFVVDAGDVPQVVLLVGLRQHMGLAQGPPQGGGRGQRHGGHHGQQPEGGMWVGLAGAVPTGRQAGQGFTGG